MYEMNAAETALVAALRSGDYKQASGGLRMTDTTFCCLGVACDVLRPAEWVLNASQFLSGWSNGKSTAFLPDEVCEMLGWRFVDGTLVFTKRGGGPISLALLNDEGWPFSRIADIIEAGLVDKKGPPHGSHAS